MTSRAASSSEAQAILGSILESTNDLIWAVDIEHFGLLIWNSALRQHMQSEHGFGVRVGATPDEMLLPGAAVKWKEFYSRALREGPFTEEYEGMTNAHCLLISVSVLSNRDGPFGICVFGKDITERKRAEDALRKSEERCSKTFHCSPWPAALTILGEGLILDVNDAFARLLEYSREEVIGRNVFELGVWVDAKQRAELIDQVQTTGHIEQKEAHFRAKSGRVVICRMGAGLVEIGGRRCLLTSVVDISDAKAAEDELRRAHEALREGEARYRTLVDTAPDAIVVLDADQGLRFVDVNENACRLFGYERERLLQLSPIDLSPEIQQGGSPSASEAKARVADALDGKTPVFEWLHCRPTGELVPCEVRLVRLPAGNRRLLRGSIFDISARKKIEQQAVELQARLDQAQRLEAIGTLAGGIAHDFNNILGAIVGCLDIALAELPDDSSARPWLGDMERAASRATDLVRQILAFSRNIPQSKQTVELGRIVKEVMKLIRATLPTTISINERYESKASVVADPGQLHQIVMNLCTNAGLAMARSGGTLDVAIRERQCDAASVAEHPALTEGRYLCLTVQDTGCGIAPEHLARIFEPFFSTRPKGQGTGLGLSVVHGIVKDAGGAIGVRSVVGQGTTFEVLLPLSEDSVREQEQAARPCNGNERVLLVDDEIALTEVASRGLAHFGYAVSSFNDPIAALEAFKRAPSEFDVVVSDMTMPRLTGDAFAAEVRRIRPDVPVILVTGYSDRITLEQAKARGFNELIDKPLRPRDLARVIRRLFDM